MLFFYYQSKTRRCHIYIAYFCHQQGHASFKKRWLTAVGKNMIFSISYLANQKQKYKCLFKGFNLIKKKF